MTLSFARAFTAPKDDRAPNEDRFDFSDDGFLCAVSDGASVSFDPGPWAETLVQGYVSGADMTRDWLAGAAARYADHYDRDAMDWMQQGALDRGSFASLLGVNARAGTSSISVVCVGDSLLAVLDAGELKMTLPYIDPSSFDSSPLLLSTATRENDPLFDGADRINTTSVDLSLYSDPRVLLMTDALGQWLLTHPERAHELLSQVSQEQFSEFVTVERVTGRMRRDDTTLLLMA